MVWKVAASVLGKGGFFAEVFLWFLLVCSPGFFSYIGFSSNLTHVEI